MNPRGRRNIKGEEDIEEERDEEEREEEKGDPIDSVGISRSGEAKENGNNDEGKQRGISADR